MAIFGAPRVPHDFVRRDRLDARIDTAGLVVLRAPAGGGKTVAVADWVSRDPAIAGIWLTLRDACGSRVAFWHTVVELLADGGLLDAQNILVRSLDALEDEADLRALLRRGFAQLTSDTVVVLDDAHLVVDDSIFDDVLDVLAHTTRLRFIVLTRRVTPLESDAVRLVLSPSVLGASELALTEQDTRDALALAHLEPQTPDFAEVLRSAVDGSPLLTRGIILAVQRGDVRPDADAVRHALAAPAARVLRQAILARFAAPHEIDFAVRCSVADTLTVELARRLSGRDDAADLLVVVEASGIGMWSEGPSGPTFTLSPLFRAALRTELAQRPAPERARLHRIAAEWDREHGDFLSALGHAFSAGDYALVSTIALQGWSDMPGPPSVILDRVGTLSLRTLHRVPLLTMLLALKYNASGAHKLRAMEMFAIAAVSARVQGKRQPATQRFVLALVESIALRLTGRIDAALAAADRASALRDDLTVDDQDELSHLLPVFLTQVGQTYLYGDQPARALELFRQATAFPTGVTERSRHHGLALTAGVSALRGDMDEAIRLTDIAREQQWPEGWRDGYIGSMNLLAETYRAMEQFDFASARRHLGILAPHLETIEHWPTLLQASVLIDLGEGRPHDGLAALDVEPQRHGRSVNPFVRSQLDANRSLLLLATGRVSEAQAVLARHPRSSPRIAIAQARIALVAGQPQETINSLMPVLAHGTELDARQSAEALLLHAAAAGRLNRGDVALDRLEQAVVVMRDRRMQLPLMLVPRSDLLALRAAAADAGRTEAVDLLREIDTVPDVLPGALMPVVLTAREQMVLAQLGSTGSVAEIAELLFVSTNTVKSQLRSVYRKLGVSSRDEALLVASERGLTQRPL